MTDRRALLDAIIADPDDDAVRLVYADWLEEHGSAADRDRAQLIRLQIELPHVEDRKRREAILDDCQGLATKNGREWTRGFPAEKGDGRSYEQSYERGFLSNWCVDPDDLSDPSLDVLLAHEPITQFYLREIESFPREVVQWKHLPRVRDLIFSIPGANVKALLRSPLLTRLQFLDGWTALEEQDVALVVSDARFAGLRRLHISLNELGDRAVELVAQSTTLTCLTDFDYSGNPTTLAALESIARSPLAGRLTHLSLRQYEGSTLPRLGPRAVEPLASFRCLEGLDLSGHRIGDVGAEHLASISALAGLKALQVSDNELGLRGVTALLASPHLAGLKDLDLSHNAPGAAWLPALASAGQRRLRKLTLDNNQLDNEAAFVLADAAILDSVHYLSLHRNDIHDAEALRRLNERCGYKNT